MREIKDRVSDLEAILGSFMAQTERAIIELKNDMKDFKDEMKDFKEEMKDFKEEMKDFKEEARRERKEMNIRWGEISDKIGSIAEDIAAPGVRGFIKKHFGELPDRMLDTGYSRNVKDKSKIKEFDVVALIDGYFIVCEIKSTPRDKYVEQFIELVSTDIFDYWPEYSDKKLVPIFASLAMDDHFVKKLTKNNVLAMVMGDEHMQIANTEVLPKLIPKAIMN